MNKTIRFEILQRLSGCENRFLDLRETSPWNHFSCIEHMWVDKSYSAAMVKILVVKNHITLFKAQKKSAYVASIRLPNRRYMQLRIERNTNFKTEGQQLDFSGTLLNIRYSQPDCSCANKTALIDGGSFNYLNHVFRDRRGQQEVRVR